MPVRNAAQWLDETFRSLMEQSIENIHVELSIYNDGSSASAFSFCFLIQFYFCEE
jgi:glycosyltransferase involved in cell wall biosynthesis